MTSKKSKKGKTIPLTDYLATQPKLVTIRTNWSDIVDNEEAETKPMVVDIGSLPTAPRGAVDIDYSTLPNNPPFVAHIANLSFEINDEELRRIFADLNPKSARVMREGTRSRGVGLVEFESRDNLIEALKKSDKEIYGRKIRVNVSDKTDSHQSDSRGGFGHRSNRPGGGSGEERPEMADRWKRAEPRSDDPFDDRSGGGFNRDRPNRGDFGRPNMSGGSRDNQHGSDFGFGYPRARDDRGGDSRGGSSGGGNSSGGRDYNRQAPRNRYPDDDNRSNSGADRPRYGGRFSDTRDTRERTKPTEDTRDDQSGQPRERQRLQLQPRSKALEELQPLSGSSSSVNNVAADVNQSSISHADESSVTRPSERRAHDLSTHENHRDDDEQEARESNDSTSQADGSEEQSIAKPSRGAGASIFGGAKPVDTSMREQEIEKKLKELQLVTGETTGDSEEKPSSSSLSSRPLYNRVGDRDPYRAKNSSNNDDYAHRDRRDEGRPRHSGDHYTQRDHNDGRQHDDDSRRRSDDDYNRRGGNNRERYGGPSRRDNESGRTDQDRGTYRNRDDRNHETNDLPNHARPANDSVPQEPQSRTQPRATTKRTPAAEDDTHRLPLSNKFGMLDDDDEAQDPSIVD